MNQKIKNKIKYFAGLLTVAIVINIGSLSAIQAAISTSSLLTLTNSARTDTGLSSLTINSQLQNAAQAKAENMFQDQYFAHVSPDGRNPWDFIKAAGYNYVYAGENLAIGYSDTTELQNAWMNSPTHRANILNPNFREIGFASVNGTYENAETTIVVEMFGSGESVQPVTQNKNVASATVKENTTTSNTPAPKSFNIVNEDTSFSPNKIFQGEQVEFKVSFKGEAKDVYIMVNNQKIDFKDLLVSKNNDETKKLSQSAAVNELGNFDVNLTIVGNNDVKEVKNMGNLQINQKVITNAPSNNSVIASVVKNMNVYSRTYIIVMILAFLASVVYLVLRYKRYGKFV